MGVIMNETIIKCDNCSDDINTDDDNFYGSELSSKTFCPSCYESDRQSASQIFITGPNFQNDQDEPVILYVSEDFIEDRNGEFITEPKVSRTYKSTSAWRGYYETSIEGWSEVLSGWTTGGWDDPTGQRKLAFNRWAESLYEGNTVPPVDVAIVTDPTSNVFSTAIGVFVPTENVDEFTQWITGELDNLRYALS
jgi:hypothetical protein